MSLTIDHLIVGYQLPVLDDINLEAETGQFIALIGKNGSGKSTFLKTLAGILPPINGDVSYNKIHLFNMSELERAKLVSIVLTDPINLPLKVKEFVGLGRQAYTGMLDTLSDNDQKIINQVMSDLSIDILKDRNILELSDGERQKVIIARALVQETPIILLDEPTTHLDLENKAVLIKKLWQIAKEQGKIVIISTHDLNLILPKADKIWLATPQKNIRHINKKAELKEMFNSAYLKFDNECEIFRLI
ncbi:MAG TPA: ABC transporter ATP-binding protein [Flavobacteriales bacterium]|jgi:iron complex transport system ATP-binding protein|nr:ABC transporter ATP-binding protein [Flavobacteriales bacterium]